MSISKVIWAGIAGGTLLAGASLGVVWYAASQPKGPVCRTLEGASHISAHLSPVSGLGPVLARAEQAGSLAPNELDLSQGLPGDPTQDEDEAGPGDEAPKADDAAPKADDTAPIVIPDMQPAPATMPPADDGEESEVVGGFFGMVKGMLQGLLAQPTMPAPALEPQPFPEAELPTKPEMREDPYKDAHHSGCPALRGCYPHHHGATPQMPPAPPAEEKKEGQFGFSAAVDAVRQLLEPIESSPLNPSVQTLELRESDIQQQGPGAL